MSLTRFTKTEMPTTNPPAGKAFLGVDNTGPYVLYEDGSYQYLISTSTGTSVYGTELNLFKADAVTTNTATSRETKILGTTSPLPLGEYEVTVSYNWSYDDTGSDFMAFLNIDGAAIGGAGDDVIHRQEPQDSGGNWGSTGTDQRFVFTQKYFVTVTSAGTKEIKLEYAASSGGKEANIWNASVKIIRVS